VHQTELVESYARNIKIWQLYLIKNNLFFTNGTLCVSSYISTYFSPQSLRLVDERALLALAQQLPLGAESLRDLRVVHLRILLCHFATLTTRPHHEGVHRPLNVLVMQALGRHLHESRSLPVSLCSIQLFSSRVHDISE